jgi:hypothetical protein
MRRGPSFVLLSGSLILAQDAKQQLNDHSSKRRGLATTCWWLHFSTRVLT